MTDKSETFCWNKFPFLFMFCFYYRRLPNFFLKRDSNQLNRSLKKIYHRKEPPVMQCSCDFYKAPILMKRRGGMAFITPWYHPPDIFKTFHPPPPLSTNRGSLAWPLMTLSLLRVIKIQFLPPISKLSQPRKWWKNRKMSTQGDYFLIQRQILRTKIMRNVW